MPQKRRRKKNKNKETSELTFVKIGLVAVSSFVLSVIYWTTYSYAMTGLIVTAASIGALSYALYELTGAFLGPMFLLSTWISRVNLKMGKSQSDRIVRGVAFLIAQFIGSMVGMLLAIFFSGGSPPATPTILTGSWVHSFTLELFVMIVYNVVFLLVTDPIYAFKNTVVVMEDGEIGNHYSINGYFGVAITFVHFALGMMVGPITGGALNPMLSGNSNWMRAMWTISWYRTIQGFAFYGAGLIASIISGVLVYFLRTTVHPQDTYRKNQKYGAEA